MTIDPLTAGLSVLVYLAIYAPLEWLAPIQHRPVLRPDLGTDVLFLIGNFLLWTPLVTAALVAGAMALAALPDGGLRTAFATLPPVLQILAAVLLSDLSTYWFHRACHASPLLWRFHRVHHSAEHLDWIAAYREHPIDNLLTRAVENLPLVLLGLPLHWIAGIAAFRGLWALYIHSNIDLSPGPLRFLLGAPRLHRWHHDPVMSARVNFANLDPLMDLLFGSYHDPGRHAATAGDPEQPRRSYLGHLAAACAPSGGGKGPAN
jgi:sterol desaturase/sphingolipid hydroxylase (fatty acid hydroxylase superfamily)